MPYAYTYTYSTRTANGGWYVHLTLMDRVTVQEAAQRMGISQGAVRQRIRRGSLQHEKDGDGRVYVYLDPNDTRQQDVHQDTRGAVHDASTHVLVDELRDRVRFLEDELRRKDTILMSLVQRVPELEAPIGTTRGPQTASVGSGRGDVHAEQPEPSQRRSWWREFFGA
jgi:excisionase family DNA binding protein